MDATISTSAENGTQIISGVEKLSNLIINHGPLVVLLSIFFIIFIGLFVVILLSFKKMNNAMVRNQNSNTKMEEDIVSKIVDAVIDRFASESDKSVPKATAEDSEKIIGMISSLKDEIDEIKDTINERNNNNLIVSSAKEINNENDYHKDLIGAYIDVNMVLKDAARCAQLRLNCDRVAVYVFHNGNTAPFGLPFFKMSCIHEWTKTGIKSQRGKSHTDMPLNLFYDFIVDLYNNGYYRTGDISEASKIDTSIKEFIAYSHTESLYIVDTKAPNQDAITGFVIAEFNEKNDFEHDENRDNFVKSVLTEMSAAIAPLIGTKYEFNNNKNMQ